MATRNEQKEQRRMLIISSGIDLLVRKGYFATTVSDIAEASNMSMGLMFHYFESKEKLYEEIVRMGLEGTRLSMTEEITDVIDFTTGFLTVLFSNSKEQPWIAKLFVLMAQAQINGSTPAHIRDIALQVDSIHKMTELIKRGQVSGIVRQGDPMALSSAFWCSVQGIMEQLAVNPHIPVPDPEWIVDIIRAK